MFGNFSRAIGLTLLFLLAFAATAGRMPAQDSLSVIDVMSLRTVTSMYASPDGQHIAFVRSEPRLADDAPGGSYSNLYLLSTTDGQERRLLGGKRTVSGIEWSPNGDELCFLDKPDGAEYTQVYALPMNGGEPVQRTFAERGVGSYAWRPDGQAIAYTSSDRKPESQSAREELGFRHTLVDETWRNSSLYLQSLESRDAQRLTSNVNVVNFVWSPDGRQLAASISPNSTVDQRYMFRRLHLIDPAEPSVELLVDNPGKLGQYTFSPDGTQLAYISAADRNDPHAGMLYVVDLESRQIRSLTEGLEGMVQEVHWLAPDTIHACLNRGLKSSIETYDMATEAWTTVSPDGPAFTDIELVASEGTHHWAAIGSTAEHPAELFLLAGGWSRQTDSNDWLANRALGVQTAETITARDGLPIEGLMIHPLDYQSDQRYPLVIMAHGGPESHFSDGWLTSYSQWGQLLAGRGFFVWYPNYRASTGRGVAFAKADHGDPMGAQFEDHLDAIADFDQRGWIDTGRVGIGGGSYGGYTAAWAATRHSEHFAAAVSFVPIVDLQTKCLTSDIPYEFYLVHYQEKWPHEKVEPFAERSPLTYAPQCRTPLLIAGGDSDTRIDPSQPFMLFRSVKFATSTPCRYIRYPGEGHGNRTNVNRYDYCARSMRWFEHYLKPGDHRTAPLPAGEIDLEPWKNTREDKPTSQNGD